MAILSSGQITITDVNDGIDGTSAYLYVRYSQNADGSSMTTSPTGAKYIGVANTSSGTAPTLNTAYSWSLIKGTDGINGGAGANGQTSYFHVKYSNDNGVTFTTNSGEDVGTYIGTYVDFTLADSNSVSAYTWVKVKGDTGANGADGQTFYTWVKYADDINGGGMSDSSSGKRYLGIATNKTVATESSVASDYTWSALHTPIIPIDGGKIFRNPEGASINNKISSVTGMLLITTPITTPYMTSLHISGYNYVSNKTTIDLDISFYAYTGGVITQFSYMNNGDFPIGRVRIGRNVSGQVVIILGDTSTAWSYPALNVDDVRITYTVPPDTFQQGWSMVFGTDISTYTNVTEITGTDLKVKAETAQTTADGKNSVFYQTSAPSTTGRKLNDLWFDTDDGHKMYQFDGTSWVAKQFGTNAIANLSVTNALIADGTIQSAKISTLDAGKITTGTLDAGKIVISNDKVTIDSTGVTVKDGEFILKDSASGASYTIVPFSNMVRDHSFEMAVYSGNVQVDGTFAITKDASGYFSDGAWKAIASPKLMSVVGTDINSAGSGMFGYQALVVNSTNYVRQYIYQFKASTTYTLSAFFAKHYYYTAGIPALRISVKYEDAQMVEQTFYTTNKIFTTATTGFVRDAFTFTIPALGTADYWLEIDLYSTSASWVAVDGVQLIENDIASAYVPEDAFWQFLRGGSSATWIQTKQLSVLGRSDYTGNMYLTGTLFGSVIELCPDSYSGYAFMDFKNNSNDDYDIRFILTGDDELSVQGGWLSVSGLRINSQWITTDKASLTWQLGNGQYMNFEEGAGATIFRGNYTRLVFHESNATLRIESFNGGSANLVVATINGSSDRDLKKNIVDYGKSALAEINTTPIRYYQFKDEVDNVDLPHVGIIMQEAPLDVVNPRGMGVDLYAMIAMNWKATQELSAKIDVLQSEIDTLKSGGTN